MKTIAILGNIAGFLFIAYLFINIPRHPDWAEVVVAGGFGLLAVLNVYLLASVEGKPSRLRRMLGYWLDAKEEELRERAGKTS